MKTKIVKENLSVKPQINVNFWEYISPHVSSTNGVLMKIKACKNFNNNNNKNYQKKRFENQM